MARFHRLYLTYRGVGFTRIDALRYAWMVAVAWPGATLRRLAGS